MRVAGATMIAPFCNGPWFVNPSLQFASYPFAEVLLLSGVGAKQVGWVERQRNPSSLCLQASRSVLQLLSTPYELWSREERRSPVSVTVRSPESARPFCVAGNFASA